MGIHIPHGEPRSSQEFLKHIIDVAETASNNHISFFFVRDFWSCICTRSVLKESVADVLSTEMKCLLISRANNHTRSFPSPLQQAELDMASPIRLQHWLLSHNISLFWPTLCWLIPQTKLFVIIWHRVLVLNITNYSYLYKTRKGLCFVATGLLVIRLD